jgi:hypothetical protein
LGDKPARYFVEASAAWRDGLKYACGASAAISCPEAYGINGFTFGFCGQIYFGQFLLPIHHPAGITQGQREQLALLLESAAASTDNRFRTRRLLVTRAAGPAPTAA